MSGSTRDLFSGSAPRRARIEIIPLIDVIFFLLATFVLFTLSLNKTGGLPVKLPATDTSIPRNAEGSVTISITEQGTLAWDKEPVTLDQFIARLQAYKQVEPDPRILINGDEGAAFSQTRYVVDEVRKSGITKIFIETIVRPAGS
jgi:biopolymer transport protein ExbD